MAFDKVVNLIPANEDETTNLPADEHAASHKREVATPTERAIVLRIEDRLRLRMHVPELLAQVRSECLRENAERIVAPSGRTGTIRHECCSSGGRPSTAPIRLFRWDFWRSARFGTTPLELSSNARSHEPPDRLAKKDSADRPNVREDGGSHLAGENLVHDLLVHGEHHEASRVVVCALADKTDLSAAYAEGCPRPHKQAAQVSKPDV